MQEGESICRDGKAPLRDTDKCGVSLKFKLKLSLKGGKLLKRV